MKIKIEYTILITIIVAVSLYLILRNPDRTHYQLPKIPEITETDISKIEILRPDTTIVLSKKDDDWEISPHGYLADSYKVKNMLDTIEELSLTALVSESKNYNRYDLGDDKKISVRAWTGETLKREFEVGKAATSRRHTFVKLANDDRVYHARGDFRAKLDQTVEDLRDKTVLSFDQNEIEEIHITKGEQVVAFARKEVPENVGTSQGPDAKTPPTEKAETIWQTADGKEGDETQLKRLLTALSSLQCEKFIDGQKKEDFTNPICSIQLKGAKGYTLSFFAKTKNDAKNYPAVSSENDYPFFLPEWQADTLMKNLKRC